MSLTITTNSLLPTAIINTPYSVTLTATGGNPPYNWNTVDLPSGLTLNMATGEISGTPTVSGLYDFINVSLFDTNEDSTNKVFTLTVNSLYCLPGLPEDAAPPEAIVGDMYKDTDTNIAYAKIPNVLGIDGSGQPDDTIDTIYTLDLNTGAIVSLFTLPNAFRTSLAVDSTTGLGWTGNQDDGTIEEFSLSTQALTGNIADIKIDIEVPEAISLDELRVNSIEYIGGFIYCTAVTIEGINSNSRTYLIKLTTSPLQLTNYYEIYGLSGQIKPLSGMTYDELTDTTYVSLSGPTEGNTPSLFTINLSNGELTYVADFDNFSSNDPRASISALIMVCGILYGTSNPKDGSRLYKIDTSTGFLTEVANIGTKNMGGLALWSGTGDINYPEPCQWLLYKDLTNHPNLQCSSATGTSITLNWDSCQKFDYCLNNGNTLIFENDEQNPSTDGTQMFTDMGLNVSTSYNYSVIVKFGGAEVLTTSPVMCVTTCILPGAKIETVNGPKLIEDVCKGDSVIDEFGNSIEVVNNIRFGFGKKAVITFEAGSLNNFLPTEKLSITYGHPIKVPDSKTKYSEKEYLVQDLVNNDSIKMENINVDCTYALMTLDRTFVLTNGVPVCTWSKEGFEECCNNYRKRNMIMVHKLQ